MGGPLARRSAASHTAASKSAEASRRLARPMRTASSPSTGSPVNMSSRARPTPTRRGRDQVPPPSGMRPRLTKTSPKRPRSLTKRRSQASAMSQPKPTAGPSTAAMTGPSKPRMARMRPWKAAFMLPSASWASCGPIFMAYLRSRPEQKWPPEPAMTATRAPGSASAAMMARFVSTVRPLRDSGRRSSIQRTASFTSTWTSWVMASPGGERNRDRDRDRDRGRGRGRRDRGWGDR